MRRVAASALITGLVIASACGGAGDVPGSTESPPASESRSVTPATSATEPTSPSAPAAASPAVLPAGVPETFDEDLPARDLPVDELVPPGDEVTGVARGATSGGDAVVIAFATPGGDPLLRARGFVVWRRDIGSVPPWRAVFGLSHGGRDGVLALSADATDLTDDGSDDALIREETGGSGGCATYRVVDLAAGTPIWKRSVCDAEIQPSPDPIGLVEVARVYGPQDPHCCPSAIRERVLAWNGDRFVVVSDELTPI